MPPSKGVVLFLKLIDFCAQGILTAGTQFTVLRIIHADPQEAQKTHWGSPKGWEEPHGPITTELCEALEVLPPPLHSALPRAMLAHQPRTKSGVGSSSKGMMVNFSQNGWWIVCTGYIADKLTSWKTGCTHVLYKLITREKVVQEMIPQDVISKLSSGSWANSATSCSLLAN